MADNYSVLDSAGATQTISARDEGGGVKSNRVTPRVNGQDVSPANPVPTAPQAIAPLAAGSLQTAAAANGTGTDFTVSGYGTVVLTVTGDATAAATVNFLASEDGNNFVAHGALQLGGANSALQTSVAVTNNFVGVYQMPVAGLTKVRASVSGYSAGHVTVTAHAAAGDYAHKTVNARTNANRNGGVLHRNGITAADKVAAPGTLSVAAVTEAGSTLAASATYFAVCPGNRWGAGSVSNIPSVTPTANQAVRLTWAQVTGADYYDIFCGLTSGAPAWVGRVTEAQRAAGGLIFSSYGVASASSAPAGSIDVGIVGSGILTTSAVFSANNAYTPVSVTPINCAGYSRSHIHVKLSLTDLRSAPSLTLVPFFQDQTSTGDWFQGQLISVPLLGGAGQSLEQDFEFDLDGATAMVVLVDGIGGQGAAATIYNELA